MATHFHHVPGRLRIHVPRVKGSVANGHALESSLSALNGVSRVESRDLTGSVIVHYDPKAIDFQTLVAALGGIPESPAAIAAPTQGSARVSHKVTGKVAEAAVWHIVEKAAERAIPLFISAIL